jgi:predicted ATPase
VQSHVDEISGHAVGCLYFEAILDWHFGEIASCHPSMAKAISVAKELNNMEALTHALWHAGWLAHFERDPAEVERLASDLFELSTRQKFAPFLRRAAVLRGWARSASGDIAEGLSRIEDGIEDWRATGSILDMPFLTALRAEALYLADRTSDALKAIAEVEELIERFENRYWCAELHRLRGVFLTAMGADETQIEASFREAISTAREQKSISLEKRAAATYAEYRRQKASASGAHRFRLPL